MKGPKDELEDAKNIMKELDCAYVGQDHYVLPFEMQERVIYIFKKLKSTRKIYPRKPQEINRKPL